jgi:hypothetical protein
MRRSEAGGWRHRLSRRRRGVVPRQLAGRGGQLEAAGALDLDFLCYWQWKKQWQHEEDMPREECGGW